MQSSPQITEFTIEKNLAERLAAECERIDLVHHNTREFTEEEDAILLAEWESRRYRKVDIAELIGTTTTTCRKRYKQLEGGKA